MNPFEKIDHEINLLDKKQHPELFKDHSEFLKQTNQYPGSRTLSPLELANRDKRFHLTKFILENSLGDINDINLHYTVIVRNKKFFDLYIKHGINPNPNAPLITAFENEFKNKKTGHYFDTIINHPDFDIDAIGLESNSLGDNNTYLMYAGIEANTKQYKTILDKISPALISRRNDRDKSAAYFTFEFGYTSKIEALLKHTPILTNKDLSKLRNEHVFLIEKYYKDTSAKLLEMRVDIFKYNLIGIIEKIKNNTLNYTLSEDKEDRLKERLFPYYKKIDLINNELALTLYEDNITREDSLKIFNKLLEEVIQ